MVLKNTGFFALLSTLANRKVITLLCLGFSAGLPILLIFSTLSLWLREAGVDKSAVTYFSWAALGYSFKFVWAPLVDKLPIPILSNKLGRRRSWLLLSQCCVIAAIVFMGSINPQYALQGMAIAAVMLGFSSATQDIVIDAYRIECAEKELQALLSSAYIAGYRIGMVAAGAGSLYLASALGTSMESYSYTAWKVTYFSMAALMGVGIITTLLIAEPTQQKSEEAYPYSSFDYSRFLLLFVAAVLAFILAFNYFPEIEHQATGYAAKLMNFSIATVELAVAILIAAIVVTAGVSLGFANKQMAAESYQYPVQDFFKRYGKLAVWVLLLVGFYRVSDIVMGVIANVFYQDMGYSKTQIASVTKVFGLLMTIAGSFIGGFLTLRFGVMRILLLGAVLSAVTNILFMLLASSEPTIEFLTIVIAADNLSAGLAVAAFVAWLSSLTQVSFTAVQYAIFSSVMTLFPKLLGGYSGTMVENIGYSQFFLMTALAGIPVILLIMFLNKKNV